MDQKNVFVANGFYFVHDFDSGNLGNVEPVPDHLITPSLNYKTNQPETPDYEFNIWTRPDCAGTEFENGNRTWFYFGILGGPPFSLVKLNILNLNKQGKMFSQGMAPVTRILPGKPQWERIKDKPMHWTDENAFTLTFKFRTCENLKATQFFAFTYPFSFGELQISLNVIDMKFNSAQPDDLDDIYYNRECLTYSLERRRVDLITISSYHHILSEREPRLKNLFPDKNDARPFKFSPEKKIIFISSRVHPGETPASFVFNGLLNLLLTKSDPHALALRRMYVFKMIPILNPDGVAKGHYRTDTRGVNLNRVYLNPSLHLHPTIYAARAVIRYAHFGWEVEDEENLGKVSRSIQNVQDDGSVDSKKKWHLSKQEPNKKDAGAREARSASKNSKGDNSSLLDQVRSGVISIQLKETNTQTAGKPFKSDKQIATVALDPPNISLDPMVLRDCLGTELHLTPSDELTAKNGSNPLKELRDTLKKSISLLIGNSSYGSSLEGMSSLTKSDTEAIKLGWCPKCSALMSTNDAQLNGISQNCQTEPSNKKTYEIMFCTNCNKRYAIKHDTDEEVRVIEGTPSNFTQRTEEAPSVTETIPSLDSQIPKVKKKVPRISPSHGKVLKEPESGLFLYIDFHGHASKKGIFMYGNHFDDVESNVECMLLPRILSLNNPHFHFTSCNFTEKNMYLRDRRDGMSREGSGRVAVLKTTGLIRSYTLECNYNTGRLATPLPSSNYSSVSSSIHYSPHTYQEVGRALGASMLDLTGSNPNSKIPSSEHKNLSSMRDWLRHHVKSNSLKKSKSKKKISATSTLSNRSKQKTISPARPLFTRTLARFNKTADADKKENTYVGAKTELNSSADILKKPKIFQCKTLSRCFPEQSASRSLHPRQMRRGSSKSKISVRSKLSRTQNCGPSTKEATRANFRRSLNLKAATSEDLNNIWRDLYAANKRTRTDINTNIHLKKLRLKP